MTLPHKTPGLPTYGRYLAVIVAACWLSIMCAAVPRPAAAQDNGANGGVSEPTAPPPSFLKWGYGALGPGYSLIFLALSFTLVALLVMNLLTARRDNVCPADLVENFEANLNEKRYQEAYELAKGDESFLGQVLSAGLAKLSAGYAQAIEAMQEVGEEENMKLEHRLSYMALIGTISPMIGLFGTVHGMIKSFSVIATSTHHAEAVRTWRRVFRRHCSPRWSDWRSPFPPSRLTTFSRTASRDWCWKSAS